MLLAWEVVVKPCRLIMVTLKVPLEMGCACRGRYFVAEYNIADAPSAYGGLVCVDICFAVVVNGKYVRVRHPGKIPWAVLIREIASFFLPVGGG